MIYREILLPDNLRPEVESYIKNLLDQLAEETVLKSIDQCAYYMLASSYNTYCDAMDLVAKDGLISISSAGNKAVSPAYKISKDCLTSCLRILQEIGGTRRARKSLSALEAQGAEADESPLLKFMKENEKLL